MYLSTKKLNLFLIICIALLSAGNIFSQEVWEDDPIIGGVITEGRQKIRIAVPKFSLKAQGEAMTEAAKRIREILVSDLNNSGIFILIPEERYSWIEKTVNNKPNFEGWLAIEAESLISGSLDFSNGALVFEGRIYDTKSKQMRQGRRYRGYMDQAAIVAHTFANEIVRQFTGKSAFFNTQIVFVSDRSGKKEIYMVDYDGSNLTQITSLKSIALFPTLTHDKKSIIFTSFHKGMPRLYKVSNSGNNRLLTIPGSRNGDITPTLSPDGSKMAFSSSRSGNSEIYVMDMKTNKIERITHSYAIDSSPAWSPNGKSIIFTSDRSGMPQLYITDEHGLDVNRLTYKLQYCDHADWSPDGERVVFTGRMRGFFNIYIKDFRTDELFQLTMNSRNNEDPTWSPDGRKISFTSDRTGKYQVYIMNSDGSDQKQITFRGNNIDPRWSK